MCVYLSVIIGEIVGIIN